MNNLNEKTFKQLWRQLSAEGWKARKPKGLSIDFTYVKPGVKGQLDPSKRGKDFFVGEPELMAFGREKGLLALGLLSEPQHRSEMSDQAPVPADPAPLNAADIPVVAVAAPVNNGAGLVTTDTVSPRVAVVETALPVLCNTEQDNAAPRLILDDADYDEQHRRSDEAQDESDYHGDDVPLDAFDGDYFLDAMRSENLFDSVRADDVNYVKNADSNFSESEADDDDNGD
eukprot:jgi/Phyca11/115422/e_gw1.28.453.1